MPVPQPATMAAAPRPTRGEARPEVRAPWATHRFLLDERVAAASTAPPRMRGTHLPNIERAGRPRRERRPRPAPTKAAPGLRSAALPTVGPDTFEALGVPAPLASALRQQGVTVPFAIQAASLPDALAGRDVLGQAQTGSGKTIAFAVAF